MSLSSESFFCAYLLDIVQSIIRIDKWSLILFHLENFEALAVSAVLTVGIKQVFELLKISGLHCFVLVDKVVVFRILLPYRLVDCILSRLQTHLDQKLLLVIKQLLFINLILICALVSYWIWRIQESLVCGWIHLMWDDIHLMIMFLRFWFLFGQVLWEAHRIIIMPLSIGLIRWVFWIKILRMIVHDWLRILLGSTIWAIFVCVIALSNIIRSISIIDCLPFDIKLEFIRIIRLHQILPTKLNDLFLHIGLVHIWVDLWFALLFPWNAWLLYYSCVLTF